MSARIDQGELEAALFRVLPTLERPYRESPNFGLLLPRLLRLAAERCFVDQRPEDEDTRLVRQAHKNLEECGSWEGKP